MKPDLVDLTALPEAGWPLGVSGDDSREYASGDLGHEILDANADRMAGVLNRTLERCA